MLANRLRRVTRDGSWIPEIDGLRLLAIASVLLFHLFRQLTLRPEHPLSVEPQYWWLERLLMNGDRGVRVFFVISGMILALPFARHYLARGPRQSLRKYYLRRLTRLEPPYILALLLTALLMGVYSDSLTAAFGLHFFSSLFYQHSLVFGQLNLASPVAWSLEVEIQFYILVPAIVQCYRMRSATLRRIVLLAVILAVSVGQIPFRDLPRFHLSILFYLQYFLMGLLLADIFVLDLPKMRSSRLWDLLAIAALGAIFWPSREGSWAHALLPIPIAVLFLAAMRGKSIRRFFSNQAVAILGGMCYSLYLLHFAFIALVFKLTKRAIMADAPFFANFGVQVLVTLLPASALCILFYVLIERPCMDPGWPAKLWFKATGRARADLHGSETARTTNASTH